MSLVKDINDKLLDLKDNKINGIKFYNQAEEPTDMTEGDFWYDSVNKVMKSYGDGIFNTLSNVKFSGVGGTITEQTIDGKIYNVHTFTTSGTFIGNTEGKVELFVIGGGGAGGIHSGLGGGGGGGGLVYVKELNIFSGVKNTITVGAGGAGVQSNGARGGNGGTSEFIEGRYNLSIKATGGLGGGNDDEIGNGGTGTIANSTDENGEQYFGAIFGTGGKGGKGSADDATNGAHQNGSDGTNGAPGGGGSGDNDQDANQGGNGGKGSSIYFTGGGGGSGVDSGGKTGSDAGTAGTGGTGYEVGGHGALTDSHSENGHGISGGIHGIEGNKRFNAGGGGGSFGGGGGGACDWDNSGDADDKRATGGYGAGGVVIVRYLK